MADLPPFPHIPGIQWFHGSRVGIPIGTILLPSVQTGNVVHVREHNALHCSRVFVSSSVYIASLYCIGAETSAIYRVQPLGELVPDSENPRFQYHCPCARVLEVIATDVPVGLTTDWMDDGRMELAARQFTEYLVIAAGRAVAKGRLQDALAIARLHEVAEEKGVEPLST